MSLDCLGITVYVVVSLYGKEMMVRCSYINVNSIEVDLCPGSRGVFSF
jgi:hypothetical protein